MLITYLVPDMSKQNQFNEQSNKQFRDEITYILFVS